MLLGIKAIKETEFGIMEMPAEILQVFDNEKLKIGLSPGYFFNKEKNEIAVVFLISYDYQIEDLSTTFFKCKMEVNFQLNEKFENELGKRKEEFINLLMNILNIAYSTSRGYIAARTKDYFINKYPLPILYHRDLERFARGLIDLNKNYNIKSKRKR